MSIWVNKHTGERYVLVTHGVKTFPGEEPAEVCRFRPVHLYGFEEWYAINFYSNFYCVSPSDGPLIEVVELARYYNDKWGGESELYWLARLVEEVGELCSSILRKHKKDLVAWKLMQIASIALNWLDKNQKEEQ